MKQLPLKTKSFEYVEQSFKEWLDILGYAESTVYKLPLHVREFLHYLESQGVYQISSITTVRMREHYALLRQRPNLTRGGGLSGNSLNKHLQALQKVWRLLATVREISLALFIYPSRTRCNKSHQCIESI